MYSGVESRAELLHYLFSQDYHEMAAKQNGRSMFQAEKLQNTIGEMKRLDMSVLGIGEKKWHQEEKCVIDYHTVYYSGTNGNHRLNGVAFVVNKESSSTMYSSIRENHFPQISSTTLQREYGENI